MSKGRITLDLGTLRRRAEERWRERRSSSRSPDPDPQRLVDELEVHQIELELQNEELREARIELETALARYTEIFEFAPIGYVTISLAGVLHEANHTAARLLGSTRSQLSEQYFESLVAPAHRARFSDLLQRVLDSESREICELDLIRPGGKTVGVRLLASLLARAEPLILIAVEEASFDNGEQDILSNESGIVSAVRPFETARRR